MAKKHTEAQRDPRYPAVVACDVCGVTPRMLDYWITTGIIEPKVFESDYKGRGKKRRRAYHLFSFEQLVQIKLVKDLRDAGVSLQGIRFAIEQLRQKVGTHWQRSWIVTNGKDLCRFIPDLDQAMSLMKREKGQFVFSIIAAPSACEHIQRRLKPDDEFQQDQFRGKLLSWKKRTRSA